MPPVTLVEFFALVVPAELGFHLLAVEPFLGKVAFGPPIAHRWLWRGRPSIFTIDARDAPAKLSELFLEIAHRVNAASCSEISSHSLIRALNSARHASRRLDTRMVSSVLTKFDSSAS